MSLFSKEKRLDARITNLHTPHPIFEFDGKQLPVNQSLDIPSAVRYILDHIRLTDVHAVGHRVVHGADLYTKTTKITDKVIKGLTNLSELAPLHNQACLEGIHAAKSYFGPSCDHFAVFDTAFHSSMPEKAFRYALPQDITEKFGIRRYGFHGLSHAFLWDVYSKARGSEKKIVSVHLGAGCSMTAITNGISIDTSMGFTPCEGLIMATRSGDIDPCILQHLCKNAKISLDEATDLLNYKSGLLGISQSSSDMRALLKIYETSKPAKLAIDMFCYRAQKYLGAFLAALQGADAIVFTGGIGENSHKIRSLILHPLEWLGIRLENILNCNLVQPTPHTLHVISGPESAIEIAVVAADENYYIKNQIEL